MQSNREKAAMMFDKLMFAGKKSQPTLMQRRLELEARASGMAVVSRQKVDALIAEQSAEGHAFRVAGAPTWKFTELSLHCE